MSELQDAPTRCAGCGVAMPSVSPIDTSFTRYGWRVTRARTAAGRPGVTFYCPACWKERAPASSRTA